MLRGRCWGDISAIVFQVWFGKMDAGSKSGMTNGRGLVGMNLWYIEGVEKLRAAKGKRCEEKIKTVSKELWKLKSSTQILPCRG